MNAGSLAKSSQNPAGNSIQRLEQVVAALSTGIEQLSSENTKKQLYVVMTMFYSVLQYTYSPDSVFLAMKYARKMCTQLSDEEFDAIKENVFQMWDHATANNPIRNLF